MSAQQHRNAILSGYADPRFIAGLNEAIDPPNLNKAILGEVCENIPGFTQLSGAMTTSDDYGWFAGLYFERSGAEIVIAVPWSQDWGKRDGLQHDRSTALYVKGQIEDSELEKLVQELAAAIDQYIALHAQSETANEAES